MLSSDPGGLLSEPGCQIGLDTDDLEIRCSFVVSESARCGRYTVTLPVDGSGRSVSGIFDVAGPSCAVGGCVQPVNTFALLSPWLAVVGLVGCIGTAVVVAEKRQP